MGTSASLRQSVSGERYTLNAETRGRSRGRRERREECMLDHRGKDGLKRGRDAGEKVRRVIGGRGRRVYIQRRYCREVPPGLVRYKVWRNLGGDCNACRDPSLQVFFEFNCRAELPWGSLAKVNIESTNPQIHKSVQGVGWREIRQSDESTRLWSNRGTACDGDTVQARSIP